MIFLLKLPPFYCLDECTVMQRSLRKRCDQRWERLRLYSLVQCVAFANIQVIRLFSTESGLIRLLEGTKVQCGNVATSGAEPFPLGIQVAASLRRQFPSGGVNTMFLRPSCCEALRIPCLSYTLGPTAIANTKIYIHDPYQPLQYRQK